jgi:hypothetical protein
MLVRTDDYITYCERAVERLEQKYAEDEQKALQAVLTFEALPWHKRWFSVLKPTGEVWWHPIRYTPALKQEKARAEYQRSSMNNPFIEIPDNSAFFKWWCQQDD